MPCNLAVTITKAAVNAEQLQALLSLDVINQTVMAYLKVAEAYQKDAELYMRSFLYRTTNSMLIYLGNYTITIKQGGLVTVEGLRGEEAENERLRDTIATFLAQVADKLFAAKVQQSLVKLGRVKSKDATVRDEGTTVNVTMFSLEI